MLIPRLGGLLLALLAVPGIALVASPAQAAACPDEKGVTVVVQSPNGTRTGCAAGDPTDGIQALERAGFSWVAATGNAGGAVCRINNYPPASEDRCLSMPPRDAYWAYFHAERGGSWQYSNRGAATYDPAPGSVQGWRFGGGTAPGTQPPAAVKPEPVQQPQPAPKAAVQPPAGTPGTPTAAPSAATPTATALKKPDKPPARRTAAVAPSASATTAGPVQAAPAPAVGTPVGNDTEDHQGGLSWFWGVGLLAALGATAGAVALRRRS